MDYVRQKRAAKGGSRVGILLHFASVNLLYLTQMMIVRVIHLSLPPSNVHLEGDQKFVHSWLGKFLLAFANF